MKIFLTENYIKLFFLTAFVKPRKVEFFFHNKVFLRKKFVK